MIAQDGLDHLAINATAIFFCRRGDPIRAVACIGLVGGRRNHLLRLVTHRSAFVMVGAGDDIPALDSFKISGHPFEHPNLAPGVRKKKNGNYSGMLVFFTCGTAAPGCGLPVDTAGGGCATKFCR